MSEVICQDFHLLLCKDPVNGANLVIDKLKEMSIENVEEVEFVPLPTYQNLYGEYWQQFYENVKM